MPFAERQFITMKKGKAMRLTRRSYKRKLIMFGASIFTCVAMTASGFAAWVLSQDAKISTTGEVEVGSVTEANVELKDIYFVDKVGDTEPKADVKNFTFEPKRDDDEGRVRHSQKPEDPAEDLDIRIGWTIVNYQNASDHFVELYVPETVHNAIVAGFIVPHENFKIETGATAVQHENANYYVYTYSIGNAIDETGSSEDGLLSYTYSETGGVKTVNFILTLKFNWGEKFDGINPGEYFDKTYTDEEKAESEAPLGDEIEYEVVKATLNEFKATMHGIEYNTTFEALTEAEKEVEYNKKPIPKYYAIVHATVN